MPAQEDSTGGPVPPESRTEDEQPVQWRLTFLVAIIAIGLIAIAFTAGFLALYMFLYQAVWSRTDFVAKNRWMIPAGVLVFSLLVGLCQKYLRAPNVIRGSFVDAMKEGKTEDYRTFPGAFLSSIFSLLSGAIVGPEGTISIMVGQISSWVRDTFGIGRTSKPVQQGFDVAALSSAFNGLIGNPLFTGVFATEYQIGKKDALTFMIWNLVAGIVGYLFYLSLGMASFASMITFPAVDAVTPVMVLYAILLGGVGALIALFTGLSLKGFGTVMERVFGERVVLRVLAAGIIIAAVGYFLPALLFSGEIQIHDIIANPAGVGVTMLLLYAVLKILLLALSFKSGYIGGPIFPVLFSATMVGLALSLVFPGVPVAVFVLCIETAAFALALGAPLSAILLVLVISAPGPHMTVLVVVSATTALVISAVITQLRARRTPPVTAA